MPPVRRWGQSEDRLPLIAVATSIWFLPLLNPKGPFNSAPVDLLLGVTIGVVILWAAYVEAKIRMPYAISTGAMAAAGLASALGGLAPAKAAVTIVQEAFLLLWCAAIVTLCRNPRALTTVVRSLCLSATAWAGAVIVAVATGQAQVQGGSGGEGHRARLWFDHPNMAGNYFMVAFFVVLASRQPRSRFPRAVALSMILIAIVLTGSNSALSSLPVGGLAILFLRTRASRGFVPAIAASLVAVLVSIAVWVAVAQPVIDAAAHSEYSIVRHSVGRGARSATAREALFADQLDIFADNHLLGIGAAGTAQELDERRADVAKTSHNDYLATLVERGPLGAMALALFIGAVWVRLATVQSLPPAWRAVIPNPAALVAAALGFLLTAFTHEVLHFRHLWTLLAIAGALYVAVGEERRLGELGPRA